MGRPKIQIDKLHGYTIEELIELRNTADSKFAIRVLTTVIMRYRGFSNEQINEVTGLCSATIISHVKRWNRLGIKAIVDSRGGNRDPKLSPDIVDDLIYVVLNKKPVDFEFIGHTWTCGLLSLYIKQYYGIDVSVSTIWTILKKNNLSYKRAETKPTKANKAERCLSSKLS
ncbi:helix-turn-helix domain-containing protein [Paramaledivibacter caminithermalis]|uniref:Transposase n=1 Tax=Paramaledivibacter caminithermalis (strain DSM 15212 / CIP 107654 / DViRD3) TaxID=1121301 RepID=A0A1M6S969_PARC5|nr:helix-turn-helix domain-containing protein [Paramaledivibacter caminithermalis]SHK41249.1 Transposase [Paramaledivibacter caminithermalis DSM 15212]